MDCRHRPLVQRLERTRVILIEMGGGHYVASVACSIEGGQAGVLQLVNSTDASYIEHQVVAGVWSTCFSAVEEFGIKQI